jgi:hypothetical protein
MPEAVSPLFLAAYAAVAIAAVVAFWRLFAQWRRHEIATAGRIKELLALAVITGVALLLIAFTNSYLHDQAQQQRLSVELNERDRMAKELRTRIAGEIDTVRAMLAERTVHNIERDRLANARAELTRFVALKDPRITRMLALIDTELEIRDLVKQTFTQDAPDKLHALYARLAELAPDMPDYQEKAAHYAVMASPQADPARLPAKN